VSKLFSPIKLRNTEVRNRLWIAPMCQYSCENRDGVPGDWHQVHYPAFSAGGAGLIIVEATAVSPEGRISPWDTGLWNDQQVEGWKRVTDLVHQRGARIAVQLAHAGRKASTYREWSGHGSVPLEDGGWQSVSSTIEAFPGYDAPRELATREIPDLVQAWIDAATNAVAAGFDAIEVHAAHGYLLHQFLSPLTNQRTDQYGGSLENRARLLLEIVQGMRSAVGSELPIMVRFSATDYKEGGWDQEQTAQVARWSHELGADFFDISSGGLIAGVQIPVGPGYQVPLAEYVAEHNGSPVGAVGQITDAHQAEAILDSGQISVILIGRAALRDPHWPAAAAAVLGQNLDYLPHQYKRAWPAL
jgi:2,4-dienoyl-CoA reductase-like NADH-dependent reductase (Old Yellow Enzyme family)